MIIASARDASELFEPLFQPDPGQRAGFAIAYLDEQRTLIELTDATSAGEESGEMPVRRILADALRLGASGIVLASCHPDGDPQPSFTDIQATRELDASARSFGMRLVDHLIYGGEECTSVRALGLI